MRDLTLNDLADEIRQELKEQGIELSAQAVRGLTIRFFRHVEEVMQHGKYNFQFWSKDIIAMFKPLDEEKLCDEFASGKGALTYHYLIRKNKLSRGAAHWLKKGHRHRMRDK